MSVAVFRSLNHSVKSMEVRATGKGAANNAHNVKTTRDDC